jgi:hypothetical protein
MSMTEYYQDSVPAPVPFWLKPIYCGLIKTDTLIRVIRLRQEVSHDDRETQDLYGRVQA